MATKKEYVEAAVERIKEWCRSTNCEIPDSAYVSIAAELRTIFEVGISFFEVIER